jgi:hypothetical protein
MSCLSTYIKSYDAFPTAPVSAKLALCHCLAWKDSVHDLEWLCLCNGNGTRGGDWESRACNAGDSEEEGSHDGSGELHVCGFRRIEKSFVLLFGLLLREETAC